MGQLESNMKPIIEISKYKVNTHQQFHQDRSYSWFYNWTTDQRRQKTKEKNSFNNHTKVLRQLYLGFQSNLT